MPQCGKDSLGVILQDEQPADNSKLLRWQVIGALDVAWEVVLIAMTAALVWNLQAPLSTKVQVVSAFLFRLP